MKDPLTLVTKYSEMLLAVFCVCLVALNVWRLEEWGVEGFHVWFTHTIMQTTLFDFAWVLGILLVFVHQDARKLGISYGWIVPTFPFMPTIGLLLYFVMRKRALARRAE